MNQNEIITAVVALMVCGLIAGTTAIPLIAGISQETINEEYNDESLAGWVRMAYGADDFDVSLEADAGTINAGGQTGTVDSIVYADDKLSVYATGDKLTIVNGYATTPAVVEATNVQITNADGAISVVADGDTIVSGDSPAWAYYPDASGKYAYFDASNEGIKVKDDVTPAYVGNFAGVWAYNDVIIAPDNAGDLGLSLNAVVEDGAVSSVTWAKVANTVESNAIDPDTITLQPLNPSVIDNPINGGGITIQSADPTTGTRIGDLYYKFTGLNATVVGFASTTDWSTFTAIPDTVDRSGVTYTITIIGNNAFNGAGANLTLTSLPEAVTTLDGNAFFGCTNLALTSLPAGVTSIGGNAFKSCTNLKTLIVQSSPTIGVNAFINCTNLKEVLNLGDTDITANSYGLNADEVRSDIPASGYVAPLSINEVVTKTGAVFEIIGLLPLIMILGVVMVGVYVVANRYA